jgi:HJR/Mrr/RecB family endonuclease
VAVTSNDTTDVPEGRTVAVEEDALTRVVGRLALTPALLLAAAVYVGIGLALPLAIGACVPLLIGLNAIGALFSWAITLAWLFPVVEARVRRQLLELTTDLRRLSAPEFEQLVGELLRCEGWDVQETGGHDRPDGNVDLRIRRVGRELLVQCKRWDSRTVGVDEVRKLAGTLVRERLPRDAGVLVTSSSFTAAAITEAHALQIELVDGRALLRRLERAGATGLLRRSVDVRAAYPCPNCAEPMVLDRSMFGWWLHCPRYFQEACRGKRDLGTDPRRALELLLTSRRSLDTVVASLSKRGSSWRFTAVAFSPGVERAAVRCPG